MFQLQEAKNVVAVAVAEVAVHVVAIVAESKAAVLLLVFWRIKSQFKLASEGHASFF